MSNSYYRCKFCGQKSPISNTHCTNPECGALLSIYAEVIFPDSPPPEQASSLPPSNFSDLSNKFESGEPTPIQRVTPANPVNPIPPTSPTRKAPAAKTVPPPKSSKGSGKGGKIALIVVAVLACLSVLLLSLATVITVIVFAIITPDTPETPSFEFTPSVGMPTDPTTPTWEDNVMKRCPVEYNEDTIATQPFYIDALPRHKVGTVTFLDSTAGKPADPNGVVDLSISKDGTVLLWMEHNGTDYDVTIAADGGINGMFATEALFYGCINLRSVSYGGAFHTDYANCFSSYYDMCAKLTDGDVSELTVTSSARYLDFMFSECKALTTLDLSHFDTSGVLEMDAMFQLCESLTSLDVSSFDTSNVTNMSWMFNGCSSLRTLDIRHFNTSNVTDMHSMVRHCRALTSLDLSTMDTAKVTDMAYMFSNCSALTSLDFSSADTRAATDMSYMFENCSSLTSITTHGTCFTLEKANIEGIFNNCPLDVDDF